MAPWDELPYFDTPTVHQFQNVVDTTTPSIPPNPMRVAILFRVTQSGNTAIISPLANPSSSQGWNVGNTQDLQLTHRNFPQLTQGPWFVNVAVGNQLMVVEIIMSKWPRERSEECQPDEST